MSPISYLRFGVTVLAAVLCEMPFAHVLPAAETFPHLQWTALNEPGSGGAITALAVSPHDPQRVLVGGDMLGIGVSENRGESWLPSIGLPSYEIGEFTFHPKDPLVVWAGTMSGPCVSRDGGHHWEWQRQGFPAVAWGRYSAPVQKILFDPQHAGRLLALGGSRRRWSNPDDKSVWAVWESVDDGVNWKELSRIDGSADVMAAGFGPGANPPIYVALHNKGVWVSTDGGRAWSARNEGLTDRFTSALAIDPQRPGRLWVSVGNPHGNFSGKGGVFLSTDGGLAWTKLDMPGGNYSAVALCESVPATLYACEFGWQGGTTFVSENAGVSWRASLANPVFSRAYRAGAQMGVLAVDPRDPRTAFTGNTETIARTHDGGRVWNDATSKPTPSGAWSGRGYSGLCAQRFRFDPDVVGHTALMAMDNGNLWQSRDNLGSWTWGGGEGFPGWGKVQDIAFAGGKGQIMYLALEACELGVVARTSDGGQRWRACANRGLPSETVMTVLTLSSAPDDVWAVNHSGRIYRSHNAGDSWTQVLDAGITALAPLPNGMPGFVAGGRAGLFITTDGEHFVALPGSPHDITAVAVGGKEKVTLVVVAGNALWRSVDGAWTKVREQERIGQIVVDPGDSRRIAFTTGDDPYHDQTRASGIWVSTDGGATWSQQIDGLPMLRGGVLALDPHDPTRLVFGTNGRGYFTATWPR